ncbi:hypothetical protein NQ318_012117 [Aromia moschata]|uniref:Mutator-like transposase domain-containing protein n=1 Tax=Aromia moschata TaxID=1265417 RepID=A0AAV8YRN5_9CUCU|nr:hypothetical protein NQ318_012117 [Aromia moschata]
MPLNERDRIEILMMIGVGDRMRTQQEVCRLFHEMHPDREPVSQSTVSRIERKYRELGHVRDAPRQGRPKINENVQQDVILSALENPHCTVRQVSRDLNIGKSSVSNIFKKVKYHPYRVRLIHELAEDYFDRRTKFCEYMMDHNNQNNGFIANILFSDEATFFLNGHVNRQNTRYWSQENPHWMQEYHTQHPQKYIGDGDGKTFKAILDWDPYNNDPKVMKRECVGHVEKRMEIRLRNGKKTNKGLGGRGQGKLTIKMNSVVENSHLHEICPPEVATLEQGSTAAILI